VSAFQYIRTGDNVSIIINAAYINDEIIVEGDEIGTFTTGGVCAGAVLMEAGGFGNGIGMAAWADDENTPDVVEGYVENEAFSFRLWDRSTGTEYETFINWEADEVPAWVGGSGPHVITELLGYDVSPPIIRLSSESLNFGNVYVFDGESATRDLTISNIGGENLTVQSVVSDNNAFSLDFPQAVVLEPNASTTVTITFVPPEVNNYEGVITVTSDDPRNGEVTVDIAGVGLEAPAPDLQVNADLHAFGTVEVGSPATWTLEITNNGYEVLTIDNIQSGNEAYTTDFAGDPVNLARNESLNVVITFDPPTAGQYNTNLIITSNDNGVADSEYTVGLMGAAIAADIAVTPSPVDFGEVIFGETGIATLTISNEGDVNLVISQITIPGDIFSSDWAGEQTIEPDDEYILNLTFAPAADQAYEEQLTIVSNDPVDGNLNVTLQGTGLPQPPPNLVIADEDLTHDFGEVFVDNSRNWQFTVTNDGYQDLVISNIVSSPEVFTTNFPGGDGWTIAGGGGTQVITATFTPADEVEYNGTLTIVSNHGGNDNTETPITVSGTGTLEQLPEIDFSTLSVAFGNVKLGRTGNSSVQVTNIGDADLSVQNAVLVNNDDDNAFEMNWDGAAVLAPNESLEISLTFSPEAVQAYDAVLRITSDDADEGTVDIALTGTGIPLDPAEITVAEEDLTHDFGNVIVGANATWDLQISNTGDLDLEITEIISSNAVFTTNLPQDGATIAGGESATYTVTFAPEAIALYEATLTINSNDDALRINVSGRGIGPEISVDPASIDFGTVRLGNSGTETLEIQNSGDAVMTVSQIQFDNEAFSSNFDGEQTVQPDGTLSIEVSFAPDVRGEINGVMTIVSDAQNDQSLDVNLTGSGDLHFPWERTAVSHNIIIDNATIDDVQTVAGDEVGVFTPAGLCAGSESFIDPGEQIGIAAWGDDLNTQEVEGFRAGEEMYFKIWDNSAQEEYDAFAEWSFGNAIWVGDGLGQISLLYANSQPTPLLELSADALNFGEVYVFEGESSTQELTLENVGNADLVISNIASNNNAYTTDFDQEITIPMRESAVVTITFIPPQEGEINGILTITSNDADNEEATVDLTGTGVEAPAPALGLNANTHDFGVVEINSPEDWTMVITNNGFQDLIVTGIASNNNVFTTDFAGDPVTIGRDASINVVVTFDPQTVDEFAGALTITSNTGGQEGTETQVTLTGESVAPQIAVTPSPVIFEDTIFGEQDQQILTIRNDGAVDLTVTALNIPGDIFSSDFNGPVVLGQNQQTEITLTFAPIAEDVYQETLTIESDDPINGSLEVALQGAGLEQPVPQLLIAEDDRTHDFGDVLVDVTREWSFEITNNGYQDLVISNVVSSEDQFDTDFPGGDGWTITRGQSQTVTVTYSPDNAQLHEGVITITSNDQGQEGSEITIDVVGTGTLEAIPSISVDPESVAFGTVIIGEQGTATVTVTNVGDADLNVSGVSIVNDASGVFGFTWDGAAVLATNNSLEIDLTFDPDAEANFTGDLRIVSNDPEDGVLLVSLSGAGQEPDPAEVSLSEASHAFGDVLVGETDTWLVTIENVGYLPLTIDEIVSNNNVFTTNFPENPVEITRGNSETYTVTFTPADVADYEGTLSIISNDANSPSVITLTGSGVVPFITAEPDPIEFGEAGLYQEQSTNLVISNTGGYVLNVTDVRITNDQDGRAFGTDFVEDQAINPGESINVAITFTPVDEIDYTGTVTITSDAANDQSVEIALSGSGVLGEPHYDDTPSGDSQSIIVEVALLDGEDLGVGDEIAVFTPDGICAGYSVVGAFEGDLFPVGLSAWGDDAQTDPVEGFEAGEEMSFRYWDLSAQEEVEAEVTDVIMGSINWVNNSLSIITLSAISAPQPIIIVNPETLEFEDLIEGFTSDLEFTITNIGVEPLVVSEIISTDEDHFSTDFDQELTLQPDASQVITVTFAPDAAQVFEADIRITSNSPGRELKIVTVSGTGLPTPPPVLTLSENSHAFGEVQIGIPQTWELTLSNTGYGSLNVSAINSSHEDFRTDLQDGGVQLGRNEQVVVTVTFDPQTEADYDETLTIVSNHNDEDGTETVVGVTGTGVQEGEPEIVTNPAALAFGEVVVNQTSTISLQISNAGSAPLTVSNLVLEEEEFTVEWGGEQVLAPQASVSVDVAFTPPDFQVYEGTLTIHSDDPQTPQLEVALSGEGVVPEEHYVVTQSADNQSIIVESAVLDGEDLTDFDEIGVFTPAGLLAGATVVRTGQDLGLSAWGDDAQTEDNVEGFVNGEEMSFRYWDYSAQEEISAQVVSVEMGSINWTVNALTILHLSGISAPEPLIYIDPTEIDFGEVVEFNTSEEELTIRNIGVEVLTVSNIVSTDADHFTINFDQEFTLDPEESRVFTVTFAPDVDQVFEAELQITSDSPGRELSTVALSGTGLPTPPPILTLSADSHDFGEVQIGLPQTWNLTLRNTGYGTLDITAINPSHADFTTNFPEGGVELARNQARVVTVTFDPQNEAAYNETLTIISNHNDQEGSETIVTVTGDAVAEGVPDIALNRNSIAFGEVLVGESENATLRISNNGSGNLTVTNLVTAGDGFSVDWDGNQVVNPQSSIDVQVTFTPPDYEVYEGTLTVHSDDPQDPQVEIPLSGEGVRPPAHFDFVTTGDDASVLIQSATLDGESLVIYDEIAVFTPGGICAGAVVVGEGNFEDPFPTALAAWGDDSQTEEIEGFRAGEEMSFRYWDTSAETEIEAFIDQLVAGSRNWAADGFNVLTLIANTAANPIINVSPEVVDFGDVVNGFTSVIGVEISNVGSEVLTVANIISTDTDHFAINSRVNLISIRVKFILLM